MFLALKPKEGPALSLALGSDITKIQVQNRVVPQEGGVWPEGLVDPAPETSRGHCWEGPAWAELRKKPS